MRVHASWEAFQQAGETETGLLHVHVEDWKIFFSSRNKLGDIFWTKGLLDVMFRVTSRDTVIFLNSKMH